MFVSLPNRAKSGLRWATPLLFVVLLGAFVLATMGSGPEQRALLTGWGALSGGLAAPDAWGEASPPDNAPQPSIKARWCASVRVAAQMNANHSKVNNAGVAQRSGAFCREGSETNTLIPSACLAGPLSAGPGAAGGLLASG